MQVILADRRPHPTVLTTVAASMQLKMLHGSGTSCLAHQTCINCYAGFICASLWHTSATTWHRCVREQVHSLHLANMHAPHEEPLLAYNSHARVLHANTCIPALHYQSVQVGLTWLFRCLLHAAPRRGPLGSGWHPDVCFGILGAAFHSDSQRMPAGRLPNLPLRRVARKTLGQWQNALHAHCTWGHPQTSGTGVCYIHTWLSTQWRFECRAQQGLSQQRCFVTAWGYTVRKAQQQPFSVMHTGLAVLRSAGSFGWLERHRHRSGRPLTAARSSLEVYA